MIPTKHYSRISVLVVGALIFSFSTNAVFAAPAKRITFFQFISSIPRTLKDNIAYLEASANISRATQTAQVSNLITATTPSTGSTGSPQASSGQATSTPGSLPALAPTSTLPSGHTEPPVLAGTFTPRSQPTVPSVSTLTITNLRQELLAQIAQAKAELQTDIFNSKQSSPIPGVSFAQSFQSVAPTLLSNLNNLHAGGDLTIEEGNLNILSPNYGMTITSGTITITNGSISVPTLSATTLTGAPSFTGMTPTLVGSIATDADSSALTYGSALYVQGRYAYTVNNGSSSLQIFDVSNPAVPTLVGSVAGLGAGVNSIYVQGKYAYIAADCSGVNIVDVSNPSLPVLISTIGSTTCAESIYVQGKYAYVGGVLGGSNLFVIDISNPMIPREVSRFNASAVPAYVQGRYVYGASNIYDVSNPASINRVFTTSTSMGSLAVQGRYGYGATNGIFRVWDVSSSTNPIVVGSVSGVGGTTNFSPYIQGKYAYITSVGSSTLSVVDISTATNPLLVSVVSTNARPSRVIVQGRYAYIKSRTSNTIQIFDLGGSYVQQLEAGGIAASTLSVMNNFQAFNDADIKGGLTVGQSAQITGPFSVYGSASSTSVFVIDQLNRIGIGTSTPTSTLHLYSTSTLALTLDNTGLGSGSKRFDFRTGSIASGTLDIFDFTSSTSRLVISANGNVGIGTQFPSSTFHVVGTSTFATGIFTLASSTGLTFTNATGSGNLQLGTLNLSSELRGASTTLSTLTVTSCVGCSSLSTSSALAAGYFPYWTNATGGLNGTSTLFYNTASSTVGIGTAAPTSLLHLGAGTTSVAPLGFTSGPLLATTTAGKIEFLTDDYYATITTGAGASFTSDYPPAQSGTYVKATTENVSASYNATDPAKSLTGAYAGNSWAISGVSTNQRFHIDLGSSKTITRIYYENFHSGGSFGSVGVQNFTFWGSNNAGAFADTTYGTDTNWTQITTASSVFLQHSASDAADPRYILATNSTAYRYYAFKFADSYGGGGGLTMGVRRIELQDGGTARKGLIMNDGGNLVSGRVPYATTNGRLVDNTNFVFDGTNLGIGTATPSSTLTVVGTSQFSATSTFATRVLVGTSTQSAINGSTSTLTVCAISNCTKPSASTSTDTVSFFASTDGTTAGSSIIARGTITGGQADFGEYITVVGDASTYHAGDVLRMASSSSTTFEKSTSPYDPHLAGVVTETAGFIAGGGVDNHGSVVIALVGRVPVAVSLENGPIHIGDPLTASSQPGVAMLQTEPGISLGSALEDYGVTGAMGQVTSTKIMAFVKTGFSIGTLPETLFSTSTPQTAETDILSGFTNAVRYALQKLGASIKNGVAYISELFADTITAKDVNTDNVNAKKVCLGATCVDEAQLQQLLNQSSVTPTPAPTPSAPESTPTSDPVVSEPTSTPTSTDPIVETPPASDPIVFEPTPEPTPEPAP